MGQNTVSHWARNSLLNETAGNLTRNVSQVITNNLAAKEYTIGDNPIMQLNLLEKLGILEKLKEMKLLLISLNNSLIKDLNQ